jgi:hypothetical protein
MQLRVSATALAILLSAPLTFAGTLAPGGGPPTGVLDANSNVGTTLATTLAGEDVTNDVLKVEQRFAPINVSADTLVKSGPGQLHLMTCSSDATATAGSIILYDNTAESGTVLHTFTVAASYYQPFTIWFDVAFSIGLYVGYTTTADVNCTVSYR